MTADRASERVAFGSASQSASSKATYELVRHVEKSQLLTDDGPQQSKMKYKRRQSASRVATGATELRPARRAES